MKIGFIGLGNMGSPIARNLLRAGHLLKVYNRSREKAEGLAREGASVASSPAAAARDSETVFSMLSDDLAETEINFGEDGIMAGLEKGATHVSTSTISVKLAKRLAEEHDARKQIYMSAPVFGRPDAAEAKRLVVVVAGESKVIEHHWSLLDAIGRQTFVAGPEPWQANLVKLCGNFMIASMLESFGEAFATMRKAGIDRHLFYNVMNELFASPVYKNYGNIMANEMFEPAGFALRLGLKDVRLVLDAALDLSVAMPFASILRDHLISAIANGQQDLDWSSLAQVSARNAGLEVKRTEKQ